MLVTEVADGATADGDAELLLDKVGKLGVGQVCAQASAGHGPLQDPLLDQRRG